MSKNIPMSIGQRKAGRENVSNGFGIEPLCRLKCLLQSGILSVEIVARTLMLRRRCLNKFSSVDVEEVNG